MKQELWYLLKIFRNETKPLQLTSKPSSSCYLDLFPLPRWKPSKEKKWGEISARMMKGVTFSFPLYPRWCALPNTADNLEPSRTSWRTCDALEWKVTPQPEPSSLRPQVGVGKTFTELSEKKLNFDQILWSGGLFVARRVLLTGVWRSDFSGPQSSNTFLSFIFTRVWIDVCLASQSNSRNAASVWRKTVKGLMLWVATSRSGANDSSCVVANLDNISVFSIVRAEWLRWFFSQIVTWQLWDPVNSPPVSFTGNRNDSNDFPLH